MSVHFSSKNNEWETPQELFDALDDFPSAIVVFDRCWKQQLNWPRGFI